MWSFLASGTLYLVGVAGVLIYKPQSMFTPDGNWKEFGIGKREDKYTAFPFWLFCITWAVVSYVIVELVMILRENIPEVPEVNMNELKANMKTSSLFRNKKGNGNGRNFKRNTASLEESLGEDIIGKTIELPKGYYVLNEKATQLSGIPKYIYLGSENPN